MPITNQWAYFDHAAVAPLAEPTRAAIRQWLDEATEHGDAVWSRWARTVESTRQSAASLIGATPEEIALVANTTTGISLVAEGFPWTSGDNVVTLSNEFPSNLYPWLNLANRGVEMRRVPIDGSRVSIPKIIEACDQRTKLITVSWVSYSTGWRLDVDQLVQAAHRRGILVLLDAIQGLGVFPLDVQQTQVDFVASDGHKWMMGPEGAGLLFVRRQHLNRLHPFGMGWHSVVNSHDFSKIELQLRPDAARFEGGSQNMVGMIGFGASLNLLASFGLSSRASALAPYVLEITDEACRRLTVLGAEIYSVREPDVSSGIVSFGFPNSDPQALRQHCFEAQVVLSCRAGRLRISPHAYCSTDDLGRLTDALRYAIKRVGS
jgi:selenocysteine lyase/cysteine desulfurase